MKEQQTIRKKLELGFYISLFGTVLILLWVGAFKFTITEANGIKNLVINHPLTFWMYDVFSVQMVSNLIGSFEIIVAILLLVGLKNKIVGQIAGLSLIIIFLMTLSYLFTTPNTWKMIDGMPVTDFFILKDIMYLGFGITYFNYSKNRIE